MPSFHEVEFLATGEKQNYAGSYNLFYVQNNKILLEVQATLAWCHQCQMLRGSEEIESLEKLDDSIANLENPDSHICQFFRKFYGKWRTKAYEALLEELRKEAQERRQWLLNRVAPPKCLACGAIDIIPLRDGEIVETPVGPIRTNLIGHCSGIFPLTYYSTEGDQIANYVPPTPPPRRQWWQFWK